MSQTNIERRAPLALKEKGQYALAFGVVAVMLFAVGFPVFMLGFFGVLAFFVWRLLTAEAQGDTRRIFEFYLSASEILRHDERRWYGFEIKEAIARGESIVQSMRSVPPLVNFALGALYHKLGDNGLANKYLSMVADDDATEESGIVFPTKELRDYVRMLRRIERSPAEAPQTSAAVRSLERARKHRSSLLLDEVRARLAEQARAPHPLIAEKVLPNARSKAAAADDADGSPKRVSAVEERNTTSDPIAANGQTSQFGERSRRTKVAPETRQTISEVLRDIYDQKI